ncbi:MAG: DUF5710 domain-containing protein [Gammaproteobacteria bacterium]|nr:DUF5710 domain-containing protein [Gammaproteobacteria bacterium]
MINLNVPYSDKEIVKKLGAKWNQDNKVWQIPDDSDLSKYQQWIIQPEHQRKAKLGKMLTIELVPSTCWFSNVRNHLSKEGWEQIKRTTFRAAGYRCEICGGVGEAHPVECHEIWLYDDTAMVQTLGGCIALCPRCHEVKHIGFAQINNRYEEARDWLKQINNWSLDQAEKYIEYEASVWENRSRFEWKLNLSWLKFAHGIEVVEER